jgi:aminopeptidase N
VAVRTFTRHRVTLALLLFAASSLLLAEDPLHLPIGDPSRRDREAPLVLDAVTDTRTGEALVPSELPARLKEVRLLLIGEEHTSMESHRVARRVLEELVRLGRRVLLGIEMVPFTEQAALDLWTSGKLSEKEFLEKSRWYRNWGHNWNYYRDIFLFAGEAQIPIVGVNAPRDLLVSVRKKGLEGRTPEEAAHLPARIDTDSLEGLRLFRAELEGEGMHGSMSEEEWKAMFASQCAWDATFARNSVAALEKIGTDSRTILVLIAGSGHVLYGLGAERQARLGFSGRTASLLPLAVRDEKDRPVESVRASAANFFWGVAAEGDPLYPTLGLSVPMGESSPLSVIHVEKGSPADRAGLAVGDVVLLFDGTAVTDRETLNRLVAAKRWGDAARLTLRRGSDTLERTVLFRRERAPSREASPKP